MRVNLGSINLCKTPDNHRDFKKSQGHIIPITEVFTPFKTKDIHTIYHRYPYLIADSDQLFSGVKYSLDSISTNYDINIIN